MVIFIKWAHRVGSGSSNPSTIPHRTISSRHHDTSYPSQADIVINLDHLYNGKTTPSQQDTSPRYASVSTGNNMSTTSKCRFSAYQGRWTSPSMHYYMIEALGVAKWDQAYHISKKKKKKNHMWPRGDPAVTDIAPQTI